MTYTLMYMCLKMKLKQFRFRGILQYLQGIVLMSAVEVDAYNNIHPSSLLIGKVTMQRFVSNQNIKIKTFFKN